VVQEEVTFYGHRNVNLRHVKSIEITKDGHLTPKGDCIMGIKANKGSADLSESIKHRLKSSSALVRIEVMVGNESFVVAGRGDQRLTMLHPHDMVIRKTNYVCPRTLSVLCNKASCDVPRTIVERLRDPETRGIFRITID